MTEAYQSDLKEMFSTSILDIPQYQRAYSWDIKHVKDLLKDIDSLYDSLSVEAVSKSDNFHYLGTVVLREKEEISVGDSDFSRYDIVDGQQRLLTISLLVSTINSKLEDLEEHLPESRFDSSERPPSRVKNRNNEDYISYAGEMRINPKQINKSTFDDLVMMNKSPSQTDTRLSSQERLVESKKVIEEWLNNKLENITDRREEFDRLNQLLNIINSDLEVTVTEVTETKEAGRLFEAINDRGKSIETIDKIRSYLIYCAAQLDDEELSTHIHSRITNVIENITQYGDDSDIDRFVREHWRVYSGETYFDKNRYDEITELNRRLKKIHANTERPDQDLKAWIKDYLRSLEEMSHSFIEINNPNVLEDTYNSDEVAEVARKLTSINKFSSRATKDPILLSFYYTLDISESLVQFLDLFEKYSFRTYQIAYHNSSVNRNFFRNASASLYWSQREDQFEDLFVDEHQLRGRRYSNYSAAFEDICIQLESLIGEYCSDIELSDYLSRDDVQGDDQTQWSGMRSKSAKRYLLYEYEKHLREKGSKGTIDQVPPFEDWEKQGIEIEHIHPKNPDESSNYDLENQGLVHSIGNLALLAPEDNKDAKNSPFDIKKEEVYSGSPMTMLNSISEKNTWTESEIIARRKEITEFVLERWGIDSRADVHISIDDNSTENREFVSRSEYSDQKRDIFTQIQEDYVRKSDDSYHLTNITFSTDGVGSWWETMRSCPDCGATKVNIKREDENITASCVCGE
jgi:uncharacterized protein with ParB-like and HNH nuclease domain